MPSIGSWCVIFNLSILYVTPGWKSLESNTEIADQTYTKFLHINIDTQILYKLVRRFIHLPIAAPIHSNTNSRLTNYSRRTTNDCDPLYLPEQQTLEHQQS